MYREERQEERRGKGVKGEGERMEISIGDEGAYYMEVINRPEALGTRPKKLASLGRDGWVFTSGTGCTGTVSYRQYRISVISLLPSSTSHP